MAAVSALRGSRRTRAAVVVGAAVVALVTGCTGGPAPTETPPASSTEPPTVAPGQPTAVEERVIEGFLTRPCDLLTARQIADLDLIHVQALPREPGPDDGRGPLVCYAERPIAGSPVGEFTDDLSIVPAVKSDVLNVASYYTIPPENAIGLTIQGLPAVLSPERGQYPTCSLAVRTAEGQGFQATIRRATDRNVKDDTCDIARGVGEAIIANLPRRS